MIAQAAFLTALTLSCNVCTPEPTDFSMDIHQEARNTRNHRKKGHFSIRSRHIRAIEEAPIDVLARASRGRPPRIRTRRR